MTRAHQARNEARWLALGWLPFISVYALAAVTSAHWLPTMVKLCWFAFSFFAAYAWTTLFDHRDVARAYFLSYAGIAAIIVIDFVNGFSRGPDHMIGFGQVNEMVNGLLLFRPHAFYYEPSFRAFEPQNRVTLIVLLLWLCVAWQFIATFPRLDLWIAFWVALAWMREESNDNRVVPREIGPERRG